MLTIPSSPHRSQAATAAINQMSDKRSDTWNPPPAAALPLHFSSDEASIPPALHCNTLSEGGRGYGLRRSVMEVMCRRRSVAQGPGGGASDGGAGVPVGPCCPYWCPVQDTRGHLHSTIVLRCRLFAPRHRATAPPQREYECHSPGGRDHPIVIKRCCASVLLVAALSPVAVKAWTHRAEIRLALSALCSDRGRVAERRVARPAVSPPAGHW
ncbi:uncharacterized protein LOC133932997 isoform X2 [Platichthys flesus]|uniref:uncharacterized protein LOC133932997 isoform X2 n=1 Tax=Platichthys flesus TaxID=8260 RepID=UPI002DBF9B61|nr:uncharacterized protein LOC133932997 isoform X2 [Platichthys flesus]